MIDYTVVLKKRFPNESWVLNGSDYQGLEWLSQTSKPTEEELLEEWESVLAEIEAEKQAAKDRKNAILERLGLTEDEAKLILG